MVHFESQALKKSFPECQGALLKASMNNDHDEIVFLPEAKDSQQVREEARKVGG